jgi:hypothetical protein
MPLSPSASPTTIHLPLLESIQLASPCPARWEDMSGDSRTRHCAQCDLDVHNLADMTRAEAEQLLSTLSEGRICARFYRRRDGTILTRDCPVGIRAARIKVLKAASRVAAALGLAVCAAAAAKAAQDKDWGNYGWSMRLSNVAPVQWVSWKVSAAWNKVFPPAPGRGMYLGGVVAMPPGKPPAVQGASGSPYGPHGWEYNQ